MNNMEYLKKELNEFGGNKSIDTDKGYYNRLIEVALALAFVKVAFFYIEKRLVKGKVYEE